MINQQSNQGLAAIPLILMFAVMVIAIPLAINQSQKVVTLQNKAANYSQVNQECNLEQGKFCADGLYCNYAATPHLCVYQSGTQPSTTSVPCTQLEDWRRVYCQNNPSPAPGFVSCADINSMLNSYCRPSPTRTPPTQAPTKTPQPTSVNCNRPSNCENGYLDPKAQCVRAPCCVWVCPKSTPLPTKYTIPTVSPCKVGDKPRKVGSFIFVCVDGSWKYQSTDSQAR